MLQLVHPIALIAVAAIVLPVAVHLWNVRQGKTLKVGSIQLLQASALQRSTSWRISNWPLLLLRCLLITLLAFLLTKPYWASKEKASLKGWVLIDAEELPQAKAHYGPLLDSLEKAGLELHNLSPQFEKRAWTDPPAAHKDNAYNPNRVRPWSLLRVLDAHLPAQFPVYLFVNNQLRQYQGERPFTHLAIHWNSYTKTADSLAQTNTPAYLTNEGEPRQLQLISTTEGNYYQQQTAVSDLDAIDTTTIHIAIYPGSNGTDAQYIQAAINAIRQYSHRKINATLAKAGNIPSGQHLICWLDEQPPPANMLNSLHPAGILLQYDSGQVVHTATALYAAQQSLQTTPSGKLYRYAAGPLQGQALWTLANGQPLLTTEQKGNNTILHFKGRFNPQWGDLVWEESFVKALLPLVIPDQSTTAMQDVRTIAEAQAMPQQADKQNNQSEQSKQSNNNTLPQETTDLSLWLWLLTFLTFVAERILAHKQKATTINA